MQPPGGGITAETGRYVCFFLDFDRISRMNVGKYQSESHLQCPKPKGWTCKKPKNLKMIDSAHKLRCFDRRRRCSRSTAKGHHGRGLSPRLRAIKILLTKGD